MLFLTREQAREVDRRAIEEVGLPGVVMMENAGRGAAELLVALGIHGRVVVCCGKGNNGGDGFVIARHLDNSGVPTRVLLFANPYELTGEAAINYAVVAKTGPPMSLYAPETIDFTALASELAGAAWIVDALFGTGLTGPVRPPFDRIIGAINAAPGRRLAVDIPSGLDCDTGQPLGATVRAEHTATFIALKKGFTGPGAREWVGQTHVIDIGVPRRLIPG
jgi:NAD(P)H-hydrate epimerase